MNKLVKGLLAYFLVSGGGFIWFGFVGWWTLIGLAMMWAGAAVIGSLAADAERP